MTDDGGCLGCLNITGAILGLITSLITIVTYFDVDSDSLLETLDHALARWVPVVGGTLSDTVADLDTRVTRFAESWPLGPLVSAVLIFVVILALRWIAEVAFDLLTTEMSVDSALQQALLFLPLALLWVWVFSGVISTTGVVLFLVGYLLAIVMSIQAAINA